MKRRIEITKNNWERLTWSEDIEPLAGRRAFWFRPDGSYELVTLGLDKRDDLVVRLSDGLRVKTNHRVGSGFDLEVLP